MKLAAENVPAHFEQIMSHLPGTVIRPPVAERLLEEERVLDDLGVLSQVVEADFRPRHGAELFDHVGVSAQVAQHAIADAAARYLAEFLFDRL